MKTSVLSPTKYRLKRSKGESPKCKTCKHFPKNPDSYCPGRYSRRPMDLACEKYERRKKK